MAAMRKPTWCLALLLVTLSAAASARAESIIYGFSGTITFVFDETSSGLVAVGDPFSGQFVYESTTPDGRPADPDHGRYQHGNPLGVNGLSVSIGGSFAYALEQDGTWIPSIQRLADEPADDTVLFQYVDTTGTTPFFPTVEHIQGDIDLRSPDGYLPDDSLIIDLILADFTLKREFDISGLRPIEDDAFLTVFQFTGTIESLVRQPAVPEPGSLALALVSLSCLAWVAYRERRRIGATRHCGVKK